MRDSGTSEGGLYMTSIQWLSETRNEVREWFRPVRYELAPAHQARQTRKARCFSFIAVAVLEYGFPLTAWAADLAVSASVQPRKVVAAGVGYENAETSSITVKTYDAENGEILSEETYELKVKEAAVAGERQPSERVFAGGAGPGTDGLFSFKLRVYDAATGKFLWEGFLNLSANNQESSSTHRVMAQLTPQALASRTRSRSVGEGEPQFALRAVDSATGQLVWTDQFSGAGRLAKAERISRAAIGQTEEPVAPSRQIEFRVQMFNDQERQLLWEDTIEPAVEEVDVTSRQDEAAENIPAWRSAGPEEKKREAI